MPKDLSSIFSQYQKKPDPKKPDPEKPKTEEKNSVVVISGTPNGATTETVPKSSIFPPKTPPPVQTPPTQPQPTQPSPNPVGQPKTTPATTNNDEFDYSPEEPLNKHIVMVYGLKGSGKTSLAFSFPGSHICFSFDKKSTTIKENLSENDKKRITVYDGIRYLDKSSADAWLISSNQSWKYITGLFKKITDRPDWVVVDGGEVFETIAEMVMRHKNNLQPFQGITNRNVWKERRMYIDQFFNACLSLSKKGLIWTSYVSQTTIYDAGSVTVSRDIPRWIDVVEQQTDSVIRVERETERNSQQFHATVETSKWKSIPCSSKTNVTNEGIKKLAKGEL